MQKIGNRAALRLFLVFLGLWFFGLQTKAQSSDSTVTILRPLTIDELNAEQYRQLSPDGNVYARASALGDDPTAIVALHYLLAADPGNPFLQDSLAALYWRVGNLTACHRWCLELLKTRPNAGFVLQLAAGIEEQRGDFAAALEHYAHVYQLAGGYFWRYKVAGLQFQLGRYGECGSNIESMLTDTAIDDELVHIDWGTGNGDVPLRSALLNLRGNLELALNKEGLARKSFKEALKLAPGFGLARQNLDALIAKNQPQPHEGGGG